MSKAKLGDGIVLDIEKLIETRMLIQANSGGGKSYAVRKLLEETHGKVQQIVLDMEGEFGTLREKYDYILAGKGGDLEASPKTAELLARKVLELEVSLIVDLYELKKPDRIRFVRNFVDALVNSPKKFWHPVLIVIDEAHVFAPEKGDSEAAGAIIDLATRGRKRGFSVVLATQRLAKLNKDVAAECLNKLIGRTSLDIDRKRASDELGFVSQKDSLTLRALKAGQFYSFGPALHDEVILGQIGKVSTTHPKAGQRLGFKRTRPTAHIKSVLKKLTDLPKEAEEEMRTIDELRAQVTQLKQELKSAPKAVEQKAAIDLASIRSLNKTKREIAKHILKLNRSLADAISPVVNEAIARCNSALELSEPNEKFFPVDKETYRPVKLKEAPKGSVPWTKKPEPVSSEETSFGACERKILGFLASKPRESFTKVQVGAMTGYSHGSGGFNNSLSKLTQAGLIERHNGGIRLTEHADVSQLVHSVPHRLEDWIAKLGACERKIYETLLSSPETSWEKAQIAETTGYSAGSGGFNNSLSRLNTLGLIQRDHGGSIRINPEVVNL